MIDINTKEVHMAICPNNLRDAQILYAGSDPDFRAHGVRKYHPHENMNGLQWLVSQ